MFLEKDIAKANEYSKKDFAFSELAQWSLITKDSNKFYHKFRYANSLRLCGFFKESEKVFNSIPPNKIPKEYRHLFYSHFGVLYQELGRFSEALEQYLKYLKLKSDDTVPFIFIANILKMQERNREAIKYLQTALTKDGDIDEVNYNLATSYLRIGKSEEALASISACLKIDPKFPNAKKLKKDILLIIKR